MCIHCGEATFSFEHDSEVLLREKTFCRFSNCETFVMDFLNKVKSWFFMITKYCYISYYYCNIGYWGWAERGWGGFGIKIILEKIHGGEKYETILKEEWEIEFGITWVSISGKEVEI